MKYKSDESIDYYKIRFIIRELKKYEENYKETFSPITDIMVIILAANLKRIFYKIISRISSWDW